MLSGDFRGAWEAIQSVFAGWDAFFQGLLDDIIGIFASIGKAFWNIGKNLVDGLLGGIKETWETLTSWISRGVETVKEQFTGKEGFDEHSPSHWARDVFYNVGEGGIGGFEAIGPDLIKSADEIVSDLQDAFETPFSVNAPAFSTDDDLNNRIQSAVMTVNPAAHMSPDAGFDSAYPGAAPQNQQPIQIVIHVDLAGTELTTLVRTIFPYLQEEANRRGTGW